MKLYAQRLYKNSLNLRVLFLVCVILVGAFVCSDHVYAADGVSSFEFMNPLTKSANKWNYFPSTISDSFASGYYDYDVYIPFFIRSTHSYLNGDYISNFDVRELNIFPFHLSSLSASLDDWMEPSFLEIVDSSMTPIGVTYSTCVVNNGSSSVIPNAHLYIPSTGSFNFPVEGVTSGNHLTFRWYMKNQNIHFGGNCSDIFYFHLVFRSTLGTNLYFTVDTSNRVFTSFSPFVFVSDKSISGEIQDVEGAVNQVQGAVEDVNDTIKQEHKEEVDSANTAGSSLGFTLTNVTNTLSTIEILKLPWTMLQDVYDAISGKGSFVYFPGFRFPSFYLMGYQIWPEYVVLFNDLDSQFSTLFNSVRAMSGFLLCFSFGNYLRSFYTKVFGNSESDGD